MNIALTAFPASVQEEISQVDFKEVNETCHTHVYSSYVEVMVRGKDAVGRSCCKIFNYPKSVLKYV